MQKLAFLFFALLAISAPVLAGERVPPVVLSPLPDEYADQFRRFQGIPSLAVTDDQNIWACWYTGGVTEDRDNYVVVVHSTDGGETWSAPLFAIDQPGEPREYDPSIWYAPDGKLHVYWAQRPGEDGPADVWTLACSNPNTEPVWEKTPQFVTSGVMMNKPITDSRGRWIFPVSVWNLPWAGGGEKLDRSPNGPCGAWFVVSEDQGKTYTKLGRGYTPVEYTLFDEHSIVELKDGRFWIMNRTNKGIGDFYSSDGGKTWTDFQPSKIPHTSSRTFLRRLASGNLILVKNGPIDQDVGRRQMMAFLSRDDGQTWEGGLMLDERDQVSYPDGDQTPDGTIFVIHDFQRLGAKQIFVSRITETDILAGKLVSPKSRLKILVNQATGQSVAPASQKVVLNPNKDGKPFQTGPAAQFEPVQSGDSVTTFETGCKLFTNREYRNNEVPDYLKDRNFLLSTIDSTEAKCVKSGWAYVVTPMPNRNRDSLAEFLLSQGFEKAAKPEFTLFGTSANDTVTLFQKKVETGETIKFGKWGILIF
ncbi:MAG: sialidase family protein [Thermoguttaceae bacterium]|nr:sialidase family protein [Thermoguttaceae bacterium]